MCIVFSNVPSLRFVTGEDNWRYMSNRVKEHEQSKVHKNSVADYLSWRNDHVIEKSLIKQNIISKEYIREKRNVLHRIIDIIKLIGKLSLPYRGKRNETAYTLVDVNVKRGNFLELVIFLSKYDVTMEKHIQECIKKSTAQKERSTAKGGKGGRGSMITFLSKETINLILDIINREMKSRIAIEVKTSGMFSVQIDSTQDVTAKDQVSVMSVVIIM